MSASRLLFISYMTTPNYIDAVTKEPYDGSVDTFGFGEMSVEVDYPIRTRADLARALNTGLEAQGVTGRRIAIMHWRFYEE